MKDSCNGQTLIETLLALAVVGLVVIGLARTATVALRNAQFAKNQALATEYAQEGMEKTRQLRDQNPEAFWQKSGTETENLGYFTREITYNELEQDQKMEVTVTVSWNSHQAELTSFLTKWQ